MANGRIHEVQFNPFLHFFQEWVSKTLDSFFLSFDLQGNACLNNFLNNLWEKKAPFIMNIKLEMRGLSICLISDICTMVSHKRNMKLHLRCVFKMLKMSSWGLGCFFFFLIKYLQVQIFNFYIKKEVSVRILNLFTGPKAYSQFYLLVVCMRIQQALAVFLLV